MMKATMPRLGRKANSARQQLLRFILDGGLREGDRLPAQNQLRLDLNMGATTIASALNALQREGVLEIRDKVGVFVKRNNPNGMAGRLVAIGAPVITGTTFGAMLICFLQAELQKCGCRAMVFFNSGLGGGLPLIKEDFPGLRLALDTNQVDGFITTENLVPDAWRSLSESGHCPCYTGFSQNPPCGVVPALEDYSRTAAMLCRDRYRVKPTLVLTDPHYEPADLVAAGLCEAARIGYEPGVGAELWRRYMGKSPLDRPGALVFHDDTVVSEFACAAAEGGAADGWRPRLVALRNRQIQLFLPVPDVDWFELDIREIACETVRLLLRRLRGEDARDVRVLVPIRPVA